MNSEQRFTSFAEFYPFYLSEHHNRISRRWHFVGSAVVLMLLIAGLIMQRWRLLWLMPVAGYGCAWIGHFFFEKNRPATFRYPLYSLIGDWRLFFDILRGRVKL
jgi:hypothetical protein